MGCCYFEGEREEGKEMEREGGKERKGEGEGRLEKR